MSRHLDSCRDGFGVVMRNTHENTPFHLHKLQTSGDKWHATVFPELQLLTQTPKSRKQLCGPSGFHTPGSRPWRRVSACSPLFCRPQMLSGGPKEEGVRGGPGTG